MLNRCYNWVAKLEKMITREQYLEALAIIDEYHFQNIKLKRDFYRDFYKDLQVGDFIVFEKVNSNSKYLTVGKKYKVVKVDDGWRESSNTSFMFYDDRNKCKYLRKRTTGYTITLV